MGIFYSFRSQLNRILYAALFSHLFTVIQCFYVAILFYFSDNDVDMRRSTQIDVSPHLPSPLNAEDDARTNDSLTNP